MAKQLSAETLRCYGYSWKYLQPLLSDISNVEKTISELNSIKMTSKNKPVSDDKRKNYLAAIMYQVRDKPEIHEQYRPHMSEYILAHKKNMESQKGSEIVRNKLKDLKWSDIINYKNQILKMEKFSDEMKLLIRLYTEVEKPVRNDFLSIRVFIDEPRPVDFSGNCLMLTRKPIEIKYRKKIVVKKSESIDIDDCDKSTAVIYPVRNIMWLTEFKTSKHETIPDIIQSIPTELANDLIAYCTTNNVNTLFNITSFNMSMRISNMFYQVSGRKIGINVMRHLKIMDDFKDAPMLLTRKQTASKMGHGIYMQELYRIKV